MAEQKVVRLTHPNGVTVSVREEKADALRTQGYGDAKTTSKSSKS